MHVRIRELANLFPQGSILIDIGSDHGYLGLHLLREGKAAAVVNIDLSKDALVRSEKVYSREGLGSKVTFIRSDGFNGLVSWPPNSVVVLAGMGTSQILRILQKVPAEIEHLIILSHTDCYRIRRWAVEAGFFIQNEKYVDDGEFVYLIIDMVRKSGRVGGTSRDYILGRREFWNDGQKELFRRYWAKHVQRLLNIPLKFRDEVEEETIRVLKEERII